MMSWKGLTSASQFSMDTPSPKPTHLTLWSRIQFAVSALTNRRLSAGLLVSGVNGGNFQLLSRMTISPS